MDAKLSFKELQRKAYQFAYHTINDKLLTTKDKDLMPGLDETTTDQVMDHLMDLMSELWDKGKVK